MSKPNEGMMIGKRTCKNRITMAPTENLMPVRTAWSPISLSGIMHCGRSMDAG